MYGKDIQKFNLMAKIHITYMFVTFPLKGSLISLGDNLEIHADFKDQNVFP